MKILFIDTVHPFLQDSLENVGHQCIDGSTLSREEILKTVNEYDGAVIRSRIQMDKEFLDKATRLKFIARAGAGMENIDVALAGVKGIRCLNSPEGNRNAVAEYALGALLALFNNIPKADREVREGKWLREENRGTELEGKTIGIIGYGNTGSSFAKVLSGFGCPVLAYDKYKKQFGNMRVQESSMEEIFEKADVLSLHVPLTAETEFMVNDPFISRFKKNIYIINTSRGRCLRTDDLVKNMKSGKVLGACLDVNEYEDSSFESFRTPGSENEKRGMGEWKNESWNYLISSDKVILTPHIAGWTQESNEKMARILFEKIQQQSD